MDTILETLEDVECRVEALEATVISEVRECKEEIRGQFEILRTEVKECANKNKVIEEKVDKFEQTLAQKADDSVNYMLEEIAAGPSMSPKQTESPETKLDNSDLQPFRPVKRHSCELLTSTQLALVKKIVAENQSDTLDVVAMKIIKEGRTRKLWGKDFQPPGSKQPSFLLFMKDKIKNIRRKNKTQKYAENYKNKINATISDSD